MATVTKLKLQQDLTRLATENQQLREQNSVLTTDNAFLREQLYAAQQEACTAGGAVSILCEQLATARHSSNDTPSISPRRAAMLAAKAAAIKSGVATKVGA